MRKAFPSSVCSGEARHACGSPPNPRPRSADLSPIFSLFDQQPGYQLSADFRMADDALFGLILPEAEPGAVAAASPGAQPAGDAPAWEGPPVTIRMHCDAATLTGDGILSLDGWAVCAIGILQVRVLLDDEDVGLASVGHERIDVGAIFPDIPMAGLAGFRFDQRIGDRFEGEHEVRVIVRNIRDGEEEAHLPVVATAVTAPDRSGRRNGYGTPTVLNSRPSRCGNSASRWTARRWRTVSRSRWSPGG